MTKKQKNIRIAVIATFVVLLIATLFLVFNPFGTKSREKVVSFSVPSYANYDAIIGELKDNYGFSEYQSYPLSSTNEYEPLSQFGQIAILIESSTLNELYVKDYEDWGQECNYSPLRDYYISDGRLAIILHPTTEDPAFLQKCSANAERSLKTYIVKAEKTETGILVSYYRSNDMKVTLDIK